MPSLSYVCMQKTPLEFLLAPCVPAWQLSWCQAPRRSNFLLAAIEGTFVTLIEQWSGTKRMFCLRFQYSIIISSQLKQRYSICFWLKTVRERIFCTYTKLYILKNIYIYIICTRKRIVIVRYNCPSHCS